MTINGEVQSNPHRAMKMKAVALLCGIVLATLFFSKPALSRATGIQVEVELSSWTLAHGHYAVVSGTRTTTYEYWELGPLLISLPQ